MNDGSRKMTRAQFEKTIQKLKFDDWVIVKWHYGWQRKGRAHKSCRLRIVWIQSRNGLIEFEGNVVLSYRNILSIEKEIKQ